jgi:hypothetical protein
MEPLTVTIEPNGVAYMQLSGTLNDANFDQLKANVEAAKQAVHAESDKAGKPIPVLFDLSNFSGAYNVGSMLAMKGLEETNRPYTAKTAVYGGSPAAQVAAELTLALIGRDNLKIFSTRAEAEAWLAE